MSDFSQHSRHEYWFHNFVYDFDPEIDLSAFDVIVVLHNYWPPALSDDRKAALTRARGTKVQFLQDEYQNIRLINRGMAEMGVNVMFTCVAEKDFDFFYPKELIPSLQAVYPSLTGFVPDHLRNIEVPPWRQRRWDVGYRSRVSPYFLGKLGDEKRIIADRFKAICAERGFSANISVHEDDRIYGAAWNKFLGDTRFQLGTSSGASIADLENEVTGAETTFRRAHPHATFEETWQGVLKPYEGNRVIDTVSPRHFEYAALGCVMVQHEGEYGGILKPDVHYIPVKKDYSNLDEVVAKMRDDAYCARLAKTARADLIESDAFSFKTFVARMDDILERHAPAERSAPGADRMAFERGVEEKHDAALRVEGGGVVFTETPSGQRLRAEAEYAARLLKTPVLGPLLRRVGGDPVLKYKKGRAAERLARAVPAFGKLAGTWAVRRATGDSAVRIEQVGKDLLMLGIIHSLVSGYMPWGTPYALDIAFDEEHGLVVLRGDPARPPEGDMAGRAREACAAALASGKRIGVALDLTAVHPIQTFANCTRFFWPIDRMLYAFRSAEDEFYHLPAVSAALAWPNEAGVDALAGAVTPASPKVRARLEQIFPPT